MKLMNIVPFFPENVDYMVAEAKRLHDDCGIELPALMLPLHPEGDDPMDKVRLMAAVFAEYRDKLHALGITPGILVQSTLGHIENGRPESTVNYQHAINVHGQLRMRMCPLDLGFRQYIAAAINMLAAEKPSFMMIDDDFRVYDGKGMDCFCPGHTARFNAENNTAFSSEELRACFTPGEKGNEELKMRYDRFCRDILAECAVIIRHAIDSADSAIPCVYCSPGLDFVHHSRICRILAGKNRSILRLANATYGEGNSPKYAFPYFMASTAVQKLNNPQIDILIAEADTYPHHLYSKSAINMHTQLVGSILSGLTGAKLWLTNLNSPDAAHAAPYENVLAQNRDFYRSLEKLVPQLQPDGVQNILPPEPFAQWDPAMPAKFFQLPFHLRDSFDHEGIAGFYAPLNAAPAASVRTLAGQMAELLSDAELQQALSGGLLLDGIAAEIICRRGFAELLGVTAEQGEMYFSDEIRRDTHEAIAHGNGEQNNRILKPLSDRTQIMSDFVVRKFYHAPGAVPLAPASTFFRNSRGGRIAVCAETDMTISPWRKAQQITLLTKCAGGPLPVYAAADQDIMLRLFRTADGTRYLFAINLGYDPLPELELVTSELPSQVEKLSADGMWYGVKRHANANGHLTLATPLAAYECVFLRLNR